MGLLPKAIALLDQLVTEVETLKEKQYGKNQ